MKRFESAIRDLPALTTSRPDLLLAHHGDLTIEYAPFDYVEANAKLAIVGLTPGRTQAEMALAEMSRHLRSGMTWEAASERAKRVASFGGAMRSNLLRLLDSIGLPSVFGMRAASDLFSPDQRRVHYSSVLRYPVFVKDKNYSGQPAPLAHPLLREFVDTYFAAEVSALPGVVWLPLGGPAQDVLREMVHRGLTTQDRVLFGMPHPSGANSERIAYFTGNKSRSACSSKTNCDALDAQKDRILFKVRKLVRHSAVGVRC